MPHRGPVFMYQAREPQLSPMLMRAGDVFVVRPLATENNACVLRQIDGAWVVVEIAPRWIDALRGPLEAGTLTALSAEAAAFVRADVEPAPVEGVPLPVDELAERRARQHLPRQAQR